MSNIGNLVFRDCGGGVYFGPYIENKSDGIIKMLPGGHKPKGKSKNSLLVSLFSIQRRQINSFYSFSEILRVGWKSRHHS